MVKTLKRKINYAVYGIAILITLIFFIAGAFIGNKIAYSKANSLDVSQKAISAFLDLYDNKEKTINHTNLCNLSWSDIWREKVEMGEILSSLEARLGKSDSRVLEQKKFYNLVQFRTLAIVTQVMEKCQTNWSIVLFFYTNKEDDKMGDSVLSEVQGYILNTVYNIEPARAKVFSFDINTGEPTTTSLVNLYNITRVPSLVIKNKVYEGVRNTNEVLELIK